MMMDHFFWPMMPTAAMMTPFVMTLFAMFAMVAVIVVAHDFFRVVTIHGRRVTMGPVMVDIGLRMNHMLRRRGRNQWRMVPGAKDVLADNGRADAHSESFPAITLLVAGMA